MRKKFTLSEAEFKQFKVLRHQPYQNIAINFWAKVANDRGLDPASIISSGETFTGLPVGHEKWWCYPVALKCSKPPVYKERENVRFN